MNALPRVRDDWTLCHAWNSESDRAALALCAAELAEAGIEFRETSDAGAADALKMHGFELVEAVARGHGPPVDLGAAARAGEWRSRVDPRAWQFMESAGAVHGIPVAIHQSNCLWANAGTAAAVAASGDAAGSGLPAWLRAAARHAPAPLAIGSAPWQVGILFESLCLAGAGEQAYRQAFVDLSPEALGGAAMRAVLDQLLEVRDFVDDSRLQLPWRARLADVAEGRAAVMVMGDWVRAAMPAGVERLRVDGFRDETLFIADFFVPVARGASPVSVRAASVLGGADFQARMAAVKGSLPAMLDAQGPPARLARRIDAPSLTFDQCCGVSKKIALLEVVADHFLQRRPPAKTAAALAAIASP